MAGVSRSGFYKWKKRKKLSVKDEPRAAKRQKVLAAVQQAHQDHPSHGYRWIHAWITRQDPTLQCSADFVRRCFAYLGIQTKTLHKKHWRKTARQVHIPNLIYTTWQTVDRPRQVLVSDMTSFWTGKGPIWRHYWELVLFFDVYTKEIVGWSLTSQRGWNEPYYKSLEQAIESINTARINALANLEVQSGEITVIHTDQGSVYTSKAYNEIIKEAGLVRSCSRVGKPTDNPVNESLNGWIKEELFIDFHLADYPHDQVETVIRNYVDFYNNQRPCYSLGYRTPAQARTEYYQGITDRKETFADRILDERPKYLQDKLRTAQDMAKYAATGTSALTN